MFKQAVQKLTQFLNNTNTTAGLDAYITSKNPQSHADVERLNQQYNTTSVCRRTV
jgi:hypothetical protein